MELVLDMRSMIGWPMSHRSTCSTKQIQHFFFFFFFFFFFCNDEPRCSTCTEMKTEHAAVFVVTERENCQAWGGIGLEKMLCVGWNSPGGWGGGRGFLWWCHRWLYKLPLVCFVQLTCCCLLLVSNSVGCFALGQWQFIVLLVPVTVYCPVGASDSLLSCWCQWQFIVLLVPVTVYCPVGASDSLLSCWCQWQFIVLLVPVTVYCPVGASDSLLSCWCQWQFIVLLVPVTVYCPVGASDSLLSCWCQWQFIVLLVPVVFCCLWWPGFVGSHPVGGT